MGFVARVGIVTGALGNATLTILRGGDVILLSQPHPSPPLIKGRECAGFRSKGHSDIPTSYCIIELFDERIRGGVSPCGGEGF